MYELFFKHRYVNELMIDKMPRSDSLFFISLEVLPVEHR